MKCMASVCFLDWLGLFYLFLKLLRLVSRCARTSEINIVKKILLKYISLADLNFSKRNTLTCVKYGRKRRARARASPLNVYYKEKDGV